MTLEPDNLKSLLSRYHPPGPPASLRTTLLARAERRTKFAALQNIAAGLLLLANLLLTASSVYQNRSAPAPAHSQQLAAELSSLHLPLSSEETDQLAHQLAAVDHQSLIPEIHGHLQFSMPFGARP